MTSLDSIIDGVCENAGADFAFVLSRKGRLVTKRAPQEMPESGRVILVHAAEAILAGGPMPAVVELPRQALVPFGGAAPVDVYVSAREEAILCVVMATYAPKDAVAQALSDGLDDVDDILAVESERRSRRRGAKPKAKSSSGRPPRSPTLRPPTMRTGKTIPPSSKGSSRGRGKSVAPPPQMDFEEPVGRATLPMMGASPLTRKRTPPPPPPDITLGEADVGRSTMAAIDLDATGPDISYGFAPIGRHTIAEIELEAVPKGNARTSAPKVEVRLATMPEIDVADFDATDRQTLPFTEAPSDAKRSFEAQLAGGQSRVIENSPRRSIVIGASSPRTPPKKPAATAKPAAPSKSATRPPPPPELTPTRSKPATRPPPLPSEPPSIEFAEDKTEPMHAKTIEIPTEIPNEQQIRPRNPRDSNLTAWHRALTEIVDPATRPKRPTKK